MPFQHLGGQHSSTVGSPSPLCRCPKAELTSRCPAFKGSVQVGPSSPDKGPAVHDKFHTLVLSSKNNETGVQLTAGTDDVDMFLVSS